MNDIFTILINNKYAMHDLIFETFKSFLKDNKIKSADVMYDLDNPDGAEKRKKLDKIIDQFIDYNFNIWKDKPNAIHVKNEAREVRAYIHNIYNLTLLF